MYKMLIADDEKVERTGLCGLVRKFEYPFELFEAANGKQAIQLLLREKIQVLITDIRMPIMDGLELAAWVRENKPEVHMVIASGYGDFSYAQKAIGLKVCDYLLKPVEIQKFCAMMEHVQKLCQEDEQHLAQELELKEYHRMKYEQWMHEILFYSQDKPLEKDALKYYKDTFQNSMVTPVLSETREPFFDTYGSAFEILLKEYFSDHFKLLVVEENLAVILFFGVRTIPDETLEEKLNRLLERVRSKFLKELFITVGIAAQGVRELAESVKKTEEQSEYKFFVQKGTIVFCKSGYLSGIEANHVVDALEQSILEDVSYGEFEKAAQRLEILFKTLEQKHALSQLYVKNLLIQVLRKAMKKAYSSIQTKEAQVILEVVMGTGSLYELREYVTEQLRLLGAKACNDEQASVAHRAVARAISIIREKYMDTSLSMEDIAQEVYLSPSYFSSVFKAETGESAVHFLARYRLERARGILESTNIRIADVGTQVGFSSSSYFVTVFRNAYGMSPSQYREKYFER